MSVIQLRQTHNINMILRINLRMFNDIQTLIATGIIGAVAALFKALRAGLTWKRAILEAAVAFFVSAGAGAAMVQYTGFSVPVMCGISGVVGLVAGAILVQVERIVDAYGDKKVRELGGEDDEFLKR